MDSQIRNPECDRCPRSLACQTVCYVPEMKEAPLMIIMDQPAKETDESGRLLKTKKLELFTNILVDVVGYPVERIYVTHLTKCHNQLSAPTVAEADACRIYLEAEIAAVKPKAILGMGDVVLQALTGQKGLNGKRGTIMDYNGIPLVLTYLPSFVEMNRTENVLKTFAMDIDRACNAATGIKVGQKGTKIKICRTLDDVEELIQHVRTTKEATTDIETTGLEFFNDKITTLQISFQFGSAWVIPFAHFETPFTAEEQQYIWQRLQEEIYGDESIRHYLWNGKFDQKFMRYHGGIRILGKIDDGMLMHYLLDENKAHGLKDVSQELYPEYNGYEAEVKRYKWDAVPLEPLALYGGTDTDLTFRCCTYLETRLMEEPELYILYRNLTMPASAALMEMEYLGMPVDREFLEKTIIDVDKLIEESEQRLLDHPGVKRYIKLKREEVEKTTVDKLRAEMIAKSEEANEWEANNPDKKVPARFATAINNRQNKINKIKSGEIECYEGINLGSTTQLGELFYTPLGFNYAKPYVFEKDQQAASTAEKYLVTLGDTTGFVEELVRNRSLKKMQSTYFRSILEKLDHNDRVHPSFLIHGTKTGRLSCKEPNLQNVPRSGEVAGLVKRVFVTTPGKKIMQCDYAQAELRIAAVLSGDPIMKQAYANGDDLHAITARQVLNLTQEEWDALPGDQKKKFRTNAKAVNFGFLYGMSSESYQQYAKDTYGVIVTAQEAAQQRRRFFDLYSRLPAWHKRYEALAMENGYVKTMFGGKRRLPDIYSGWPSKKSEAARQAINSPVQGTGGQLTVFTICILRWRLPVGVDLINTVHDSIIGEMDETMVESVAPLIQDTARYPLLNEYFGFDFEPVGMDVDMEIGDNWKELAEYKVVR